MNDEEIRQAVRETYARLAGGAGPSATAEAAGCCGPQETASEAACCAPSGDALAAAMSRFDGYSEDELGSIPEEANLGLGCGNPTALASLKEGEVVLDLGAGGGIDCFLASNAVGKTGHVIGVDMTAEMVSRARENARRGGYDNVDFRLGEIENLPVADGTVDAVISNCVINLSPDKARVFSEAYRTLKPGGRVMVSDIVLTGELPEEVRQSLAAYAGCVAGAMRKAEYVATIAAVGFKDIDIVTETAMGSGELEGTISSINVRAVKPE